MHHLEIDNRGMKDYEEFINLDRYVDFYHVISQKTYDQLNKLHTKNIFNSLLGKSKFILSNRR